MTGRNIGSENRKGFSGWLLSRWYGEQPLFKAFWGIGIILFVYVYVFLPFLMAILFPKLNTFIEMYPVLFELVFLGPIIAWQIFWVVSVWRCPLVNAWGYIARLITCLLLIPTVGAVASVVLLPLG